MVKLWRPTKYDEEKMVQAVHDYIAQSKDEYSEFHKTRWEKSDSFERIIKVDLPTIEKFADFVNLAVSTIYEWKNIYPIFSEAIDLILKVQYNRLIDNWLSGAYNPTITKLLLSSNHNKHEKKELDVNLSKMSDDELLSMIK